jgi:tellurite resistance protein TerC
VSGPSGQEILSATPIIVSLIIIEGLLSVDNALAIAAVASRLPGKQRYQALRYGIIGAYVFRGLALAFASFVIANPWLRLLGAAYLLYLMSKNLGFSAEEEATRQLADRRSFLLTILQIEVLDMSLSIDNVVAAVAFSPKLWIVCTGVFIGILALRFLAGYCIRLLEIYPILEKTAFLLVGYVGVLLVVEESARMLGGTIRVEATGKFIGIVLIVAMTLVYSHSHIVRRLSQPVIAVAVPFMRFFAGAVDAMTSPFTRLIRAAFGNKAA